MGTYYHPETLNAEAWDVKPEGYLEFDEFLIEQKSRYDAENPKVVSEDDELIYEPKYSELANHYRNLRDFYIGTTDKYLLVDYPITEDQRTELLAYRQKLRDLTDVEGFPNNFSFPEAPLWLREAEEPALIAEKRRERARAYTAKLRAANQNV